MPNQIEKPDSEVTVNIVDVTEIGIKVTDWNNEPSIRDLKKDLEEARSAHDAHVIQVNTWLDNLNITGKAAIPKKKNRSSIVPKLIRKQAEWRYASLSEPFLSTDDIFNTAPVTYEDKKAAIQNGLVLNNQLNTKIDKIAFIDEYIRTAVDEGTVIVRVGWDYEEEIIKTEEPIMQLVPSEDPAIQEEFQRLHQLMIEDPQQFAALSEEDKTTHLASLQAGEALVLAQVGTKEVKEVKVVKNAPTIEVCDYHNVTIDPTCEGVLSRARFIVFDFETSLSELEKDGKYKNLNNIVISNSSILSEPDHTSQDDTNFEFADKPRKKFVAYEYWGFWDIDGTGIVKPIIATWVGDVCIRMEENPFPDKELPFVAVSYLPVRKSIHGEPDGALLEDNQKVVGAVTRGMIDIMGRSANGQTGIRKDFLDITNKRKFDAGLDYEFNVTTTPDQSVHSHVYPEIPGSAEYMLNMQNAEAESMSGVKAFSQGISGQALGSTATGIRSALDATSKRELGILRRLAGGIKQIGRKIISMNAEFLSDVEVIRITNEEFIEVRRDDLAGNFDLTLTISTAESDNEKAKELAFMLQTMGNNMDPAMSKMILVDIARLRKMPTLAKSLEEYEPQPDPMAVKKAELEIALLEAQVDNERAKAQENTVDVDLKTAKTKTELAKGRNLDSKSDQQDQDFLDKENGGERNHELNKMDMQRAVDLDLKAADNFLAPEEGATVETGSQSPKL